MRPGHARIPADASFAQHHRGPAASSAALLASVATAAAKTLTVTRTDDPVTGACMLKDCSVREALDASNTSTAVDDQVVIPATTAHYEIDLGTLEITDQVEVQGAGADRVVLDAGGKSIALDTESTPGILLEGLTITGGLGAIQNGGELTLRRVSIEHNGRIDGGGGGIQSNGPLVVESSFIGFNSTNGAAGGAIQGNDSLIVTDSTLASNESLGPAIQVNDETTISSSAIVFNSRLEGGGAAAMEGSGLVTLSDSILAANRDPNGPLNCSGATTVTTLGGNVEDDATCSPGGRDSPTPRPASAPWDCTAARPPSTNCSPRARRSTSPSPAPRPTSAASRGLGAPPATAALSSWSRPLRPHRPPRGIKPSRF